MKFNISYYICSIDKNKTEMKRNLFNITMTMACSTMMCMCCGIVIQEGFANLN